MALEKVATDEAVFTAADSITAEGGKVTVRAVWKAVGGSLTTVAPALRRWREAQELKAEQPIERAPLPDAIAGVMHAATAQLWKAAQDATQSELDALTRTMNERIEKAGAERDDALGELQTAVEELDQVRTQLAEAEAAIEAAGQRIEAEQEAARGLRAELDAARADLDATRSALAVEQARTAELEARTADLKSELSRAHADADALRADIAAVEVRRRAEIEQHQEERKRGAQEAHHSAERLRKFENEREALRVELGTVREQSARLAGELDALRAVLAQVAPATATVEVQSKAQKGRGK